MSSSSSPLGSLVVQIVGDSQPLADSLTEMQSKVGEFVEKISEFGPQIAEAFGFEELIRNSVEAAETFEQSTFTIERATGATGAALQGLEENFRELYSTTAQSADAVSGALAQLSIRTGATGEELTSLGTSFLQVTKVLGGDLKTNVEQSSKLFTQWGVSVSDQQTKLDALTAISQKTGISFGALTTEMTTAGPVFRNLGFSFEESAALLGKFDESGLGSQRIIQALGQALTVLATNFDDPEAELRNLIERMQAAPSTTAALQLALADGLGKRGALFLADAVHQGAFAVDDLVKTALNASGTLQKTASDTNTLGDAWTKFKHNLEDALVPLGKPLVQLMTAALDASHPLTSELGTLAQKIADVGTEIVQSQKYNHSWAEDVTKTGTLLADVTTKTGAFNRSLAEEAGGFVTAAQMGKTHSESLGRDGDASAALAAQVKALTAQYKAGDIDLDTYKLSLSQLAGAQLDGTDKTTKLAASVDDLATKYAKGKMPIEDFQAKLESLANSAKTVTDRLQALIQQSADKSLEDQAKAAFDFREAALALGLQIDTSAKGVLGLVGNLDEYKPLLDQIIASQNSLISTDMPKWMNDLGSQVMTTSGAFKLLGVLTDEQKDKMTDAIQAALNWAKALFAVGAIGTATMQQVMQAAANANAAINKDVQEQVNINFWGSDQVVKIAQNMGIKVQDVWGNISKSSQTAISQIDQAIERDLSNAISGVIFQTGKIGDAFLKMGQDVVDIILNHIIKLALTPLLNALDSVLAKIPGLGAIFTGGSGGGGVLGTGVGAGSPGSNVGGIAGAAGSIGSIAGALSGSVLGIVGLGITAISGIVSGIQQAHANNLLGEIEANTRLAMIMLGATGSSGSIYLTTLITSLKTSSMLDVMQQWFPDFWNFLNDINTNMAKLAGKLTVSLSADSPQLDAAALVLSSAADQIANAAQALLDAVEIIAPPSSVPVFAGASGARSFGITDLGSIASAAVSSMSKRLGDLKAIPASAGTQNLTLTVGPIHVHGVTDAGRLADQLLREIPRKLKSRSGVFLLNQAIAS